MIEPARVVSRRVESFQRRAPAGDARRADQVCGVVLCGGLSRRMGSDKGGALLAGRTLVERAVLRLEAVCGRAVLACGPERRYAELGRELVLDPPLSGGAAGHGPIAGILAALEGVAAERFLVLACDMPRVEPELLEALLERATRAELDACLFESARGVEPLLAVYHRRCRHPMRTALAAGERRVVAFLEHPHADGAPVRAGRLCESELGAALRRNDSAHNLNTPEELARERALWEEDPIS